MVFATLNALALHNAAFRDLRRTIYLRFYQALEYLVAEMNPGMGAEEVTMRVRLLTALIDGSALQVRPGSKAAFLERLQAEAERFATGKPA